MRWSRKEVALELGAVLRARDGQGKFKLKTKFLYIRLECALRTDENIGTDSHAPPSHRRFSKLDIKADSTRQVQLSEKEEVAQDTVVMEADEERYQRLNHHEKRDDTSNQCGWLEDDDIEDF